MRRGVRVECERLVEWRGWLVLSFWLNKGRFEGRFELKFLRCLGIELGCLDVGQVDVRFPQCPPLWGPFPVQGSCQTR